MEILDTTLREGEQCFGVFFPIPVKKQLALLIDELGADFIEVGHPAAAPSIREAASALTRLGLRSRLLGHARLDREEIRLVRDLGIPWVGLFAGVNDICLRRYAMTRSAVIARIADSVRIAKDLGLKVRFTCEDASRTPPGLLAEVYGRVRVRGADRLSYADTVGIDTPQRIESLHREINGSVPFSSLHFHFHNDRGQASANAGVAAKLGAQCLDASVLGIGERSGLLSLEQAMPLRPARPDMPRERVRSLQEDAKRLVASSINLRHYSRRRTAHKSGIHIHGVLKDPASYESSASVQPGTRRLVLSKLTGGAGIRAMLSWCGIEADAVLLDEILSRVKADEFLELADRGEIMQYLMSLCRQSGSVVADDRTQQKRTASLCPA